MKRTIPSRSRPSPRPVTLIAALLAVTFVVLPAVAAADSWRRFAPVVELLNGSEPQPGVVVLELPHLSEDGSSVPLTVTVASPMGADDYIESIRLFATRNPNPDIAEFLLTPLAGQAQIATRIRLNESQTVIAVARDSRGRHMVAEREVRVTVSGCLRRGGEDGDQMMQPRVRAPDQLSAGDVGEVLTIVSHPMETGLRDDGAGGKVPRLIVDRFTAEFDGEPLLTARLHPSIAANPFLRFHIRPPASGSLTLEWHDEGGATAREEVAVTVR